MARPPGNNDPVTCVRGRQSQQRVVQLQNTAAYVNPTPPTNDRGQAGVGNKRVVPIIRQIHWQGGERRSPAVTVRERATSAPTLAKPLPDVRGSFWDGTWMRDGMGVPRLMFTDAIRNSPMAEKVGRRALGPVFYFLWATRHRLMVGDT